MGHDILALIAIFYGLDILGRIPVGARISAPACTCPEYHSACYTVRTGSFAGISGRGVELITHPI